MGLHFASSRTGEDGRFDELNELVDLDENLNSHFEVGTASGVSDVSATPGKKKRLARYQGGWTRVHMLEQASKERTRRRHCDTTIGITSQRALGHLAVNG